MHSCCVVTLRLVPLHDTEVTTFTQQLFPLDDDPLPLPELAALDPPLPDDVPLLEPTKLPDDWPDD